MIEWIYEEKMVEFVNDGFRGGDDGCRDVSNEDGKGYCPKRGR